MTIQEWEIERQRAWTAIFSAALTKTETPLWSMELADDALEEWEKRFPKPKS